MRRATLVLVLLFISSAVLALEIDQNDNLDLLSLPKDKRVALEIEQDNQKYLNKRADEICPNGCSQHGKCTNNKCVCDLGFSGVDCSIEIRNITTQTIQDTVSTFSWKYYAAAVANAGKSLHIEVNQTASSNGDCDVYVKANDLPTRSLYDLRDITTSASVVIDIPNAVKGTYYVGVYGFLTCSFTIRVKLGGECPNDCSGNGDCQGGNCNCYSGYTGPDCATRVNELQANKPVNGTAAYREFSVYRYRETKAGNTFRVAMTEPADSDCDLYVKFESAPTLHSWDYSNVTIKSSSSLSVQDAKVGVYYVGVHAFSQKCTFTLTVSTIDECPNQCTKRGTCRSDNTCSCPPEYSGDYCEKRDAPLKSGQSDKGFVSSNTWNYYSFVSDSTNNAVVTIKENKDLGDCDVYIRAGSPPTRFYFDLMEISLDRNYSLTITDPGHERWYIGVFGWQTCEYDISVVETTVCPSNCNGRGTCSANGACICNTGFTGPACETGIQVLTSGTPTKGIALKENGWAYYSLTVRDTSTLHVHVKETTTVGNLWVYVAKEYPTLRNYLVSNTEITTGVHRIRYELPENDSSTYIIGVYGNPYILNNQTANFEVVAWVPPF